jgi:phage-related protein
MKYFGAIPLFALAVSATQVKRDLATIQNVLQTLSGDITALDTAVNGFSGDATTLQSASDKVIADLNSGATTIQGTSDLSQSDAIGVATYVQGLASGVTTAVNDLISKQSTFQGAGQCGTVLKGLQGQLSGTQAMSTALTSKTPQSLQSVAQQLSAGILADIQRGIDAYQSCGSSSGGGSSTSAAPTSSGAAPTGSSSAAPTKTGSSTTYSKPSATASTSATPSPFLGAASANKVGGGLLAIAAVGLIL